MKRILPLLLVLSACANDKGKTMPPAKASAAATTAAISPAAATGLWMDKTEAASFAATRKISKAACQASTDQRDRAIRVFSFAANGDINELDPSQNDPFFSFEKGQLVPKRQEFTANDSQSFSYALYRAKDGVRIHYKVKDLSSGRVSESDQNFQKISENEAREFLAQEDACAKTKVDGRYNGMPLGDWSFSIAGDTTALKSKWSTGAKVVCATSVDGKTFSVGNPATSTNAKDLVSGVELSVQTTNPLDGSPMDAKPGDSSAPVSLRVSGAGGKTLKVEGTCTAHVKRTGDVVDGLFSCSTLTITDGAAVYQEKDLDFDFACPRGSSLPAARE
ncbi:MAG: hypothetical protein ACXVB9_17360 [Bdellovibrionota bacterium]